MKKIVAVMLLMTCMVFGPAFAQHDMNKMNPATAKKDSTTAMAKKSSKHVATTTKAHKKTAKKASTKKHMKKEMKEKTETEEKSAQ